ncbi:serine protease [Pilimelia terevasa]|uniref:Serine protease n=1 Tax=Pilimelia terevasa TaxID=53372 RepID=A0A8J3BCL1_9ACTN|nr:S8 family serine peptidase [Pilimelia terevasa]GGK11859.1 serine protease [Pilimelia terevasa]
MSPPTRPAPWGAGLIAAGLVAGSLAAVGAPAAAAPAATHPGAPAAAAPPKQAPVDTLDVQDMRLLAEAEATKTTHVDLMVVTDKGRTARVAHRLRRLGGRVAARSDALGYLHVRVPTDAALRAAALPGVAAVDLNERLGSPEPARPAAAGPRRSNRPAPSAPGADTGADNPFLPVGETGVTALRRTDPRFDGRGVTIGILDSGVAVDHPALARTTTGERKIVDWFTATAPLVEGDGTWLPMLTTVTGPRFTAAGRTWTGPAGSYRFGTFVEAQTDGPDCENCGDANRDGDTDDIFGVLYDPASHDIRVDNDLDRDFADGPALRPYRERYQVEYFGTDRPATPVADRMPFVVEYREDVDLSPAGRDEVADFVNIGIVDGSHGTHVAGIAAGNDLMGNAAFDGAAPGAKIVSARACTFSGGCTAAALTDGLVELVTRRGVDVVNISIGGLPALNDGRNARALLYNRVITDYGVQLFISAGNSGPGLNTVGDPSVADLAVSVGASVSRATWLHNYGAVVRAEYGMFPFSSRGPREDGGLKPEIVAPGAAVSATPLWQDGAPVPEAGYALPVGYAMFNGTSMAAPQTTGAAAALLSAARARGVAVTPAALRRALAGTARPLPDQPTYVQGHGLVDVPAAWRQLRSAPQARQYTVDAPVCTPLSENLAVPHRGAGLYNRCAPAAGGHRAGQEKQYRITLTRTTGRAGAVRHRLTWAGNDGTFSGPDDVLLARGRPTAVTVTARPRAGVHSAILRVDDPRTALLDAEVSAVVAAPQARLTAPAYRRTVQAVTGRSVARSYVVEVPAGAEALELHLSGIATGSQTRFIATNPYGVPIDSSSSLQCYTNFSDAAECNPVRRSYAAPMPGLWEVTVESRRTTPVLANPFTLTAAALGVDVDPAVLTVPSVAAGGEVPVHWSLTNRFAETTVTGRGGPLGSLLRRRPSIADGAEQTYALDVPAGARRLTVTIGNPADLGADLDLGLLRDGALVGVSADGDSEESVTLADPAAGRYTVIVQGYAVPAGTTAYDYLDAFYAPVLGTLAPAARPRHLPGGESAELTGVLRAGAAPGAGRKLTGELDLVTEFGTVVGRGTVVVDAVT